MNTPKIEDIVRSFYEISGMDVAIVNKKNRILARRYSGAQFCAEIHKSQKCLEACVRSDNCNLCRAREEGKMVVYKCPFGIYEAIVPIKKNEEVVAYLFVGMGIEDSEESLAEPLKLALDVSPNLNKKAIEKSIKETPRFSKEKLDAYAMMLPIIAEYIETNDLLGDTNMTIGQLVKSYIKNNLSSKITLTDLSWKIHCSTVTLTEHFKKEFGITIMEYVMQKRMAKAERLLINSELSIRNVSEACGFPNIEYFSRSFKSCHGVSPSEWRKENNLTPTRRKKSAKKSTPSEDTPEAEVPQKSTQSDGEPTEIPLEFGSCFDGGC